MSRQILCRTAPFLAQMCKLSTQAVNRTEMSSTKPEPASCIDSQEKIFPNYQTGCNNDCTAIEQINMFNQ